MSNNEKNLMGLNLSVDNDLIAEAAREAIISGIAASLQNSDQIVKQFVNSLLSEKVLEDGSKPRGYSSERTISRMEYYVKTAISDATMEEIKNMIDEITPQLRELVRTEFTKRETQNTLVDMFVDSMKDALTSSYKAKISVAFSPNYEY